MKRKLFLVIPAFFVALCCFVFFAGCAAQPEPVQQEIAGTPDEPVAADIQPDDPAPAEDDPAPAASDNPVINIWSFTDEVPNMVERYKELNPDFPYDFNITIISTTEGAYQPALDQALMAGGAGAPDIYAAESAFVLKYTQGDAAHFAMPYSELGINVDAAIQTAQIATYAYEIGTRGDGEIVGLPFQATGGAFIYRRSIAMSTWGTDDPEEIQNIIGPGWDNFMQAAAELQENGYAIVSGDGDIWHPIRNSSEQGWIVDDMLYIDPDRERFLDLSRQLTDNRFSNETEDWQEPWFADMAGIGPQPVFGFFGPAWLINYVMSGNAGDTYGEWAICEPPNGFSWGGTWLLANANGNPEVRNGVAELLEWITLDTSEDGLQYMWANGTLFGPGGTKDTVSSGVVMAKSDGTLDFLDGQNMFDIFIPAGENATGRNMTQHDESINIIWRDQVRAYAAGNKSREDALADFRQIVYDNLGIPSS